MLVGGLVDAGLLRVPAGGVGSSEGSAGPGDSTTKTAPSTAGQMGSLRVSLSSARLRSPRRQGISLLRTSNAEPRAGAALTFIA